VGKSENLLIHHLHYNFAHGIVKAAERITLRLPIFNWNQADIVVLGELIMTVLSSFELLFEQIIPQAANIAPGSGEINPTGAPNPLVVQSFFALISNLGSSAGTLELEFTASNAYNLTFPNTFAVFDIDNQNFTTITPKLTKKATTTTATVSIDIDSGVTGIFLLQPNIAGLLGGAITVPIHTAEIIFGLRGFVKVNSNDPGEFLISPQTRGTFIDPKTGNVLAEEAYPLPTPNSNNLFSFNL